MTAIKRIINSCTRELGNTEITLGSLALSIDSLKNNLERVDTESIDKTELVNTMAFIHGLQSTMNRAEGELLYHLTSDLFKNTKKKSHLSIVDINREKDE